MSEALLILGVSMAAFLSTSIDNLFLLMGLMSGGRTRTSHVLVGYAGAVAVVLALGLIGARAADAVADDWLRYLGCIPLGMGAWRLLRLVRGTPAPSTATHPARGGGPAPVFGVMLANSGDSLGVFTSLLAETAAPHVPVVAATPLAMAALWVVLARYVVRHPRLAPRLRGVDRVAVPLLLVAVGLYILTDTPTDVE
jgi:cadmium resistance protein CadD (predicted permease)